jgi:hypothetical protein
MGSQIRIVQSLWSKPSLKKHGFNLTDRALGGWPAPKYYYMSWALSCLRARALYDQVELVTDDAGKRLLVDTLKLPYTNVDTTLNALDHYDTDLWALGKIYAYAAQNAPFVHIDGDVFLWEQLPENLSEAPLVAQHEEYDYSFYYDNLNAAREAGFVMPEPITAAQESNPVIVAANAGIMGGTHVDFFKRLKKEVIRFLEANQGRFPSAVTGGLNNLFEQYLFHCMAKADGLDIAYLFENMRYSYDGLCDFHAVPHKQKFIHVLGVNKRKMRYAEDVALHLKMEWPAVYQSILDYCNATDNL